ncbi:thiamine pyrophosphate-binding protein [Micrococcus luteus]|uniref:thiamine pyrophosphate-binding protein n=1 Tax=Micrococcus luteus TaxID=1270 RepID=UPI0011AABF3C
MKVFEQVVDQLASHGVTHFFGLPSDEPGFLDAAASNAASQAIMFDDQRAAALACIGYARASGKSPALCLTPGPAFSNALTGLLEGSSLGLPTIILTHGCDPRTRNRGGFQQTPQREMLAPLVSCYEELVDARDVERVIFNAVHNSLNLRPGLVAVQADSTLMQAEAEKVSVHRTVSAARLRMAPDPVAARAAGRSIDSSQSPLMLVGGGGYTATREILACAEHWGAGVLTTAAGRGTIDESHPLSLGLCGLYASERAQEALKTSDLVVVVGSAMEETVRIGWSALTEQRIIQIDRDPNAFSRAIPVEFPILSDAGLGLLALKDATNARSKSAASLISTGTAPRTSKSLVSRLLQNLWNRLPAKTTLVQENGLHDMWSYDSETISVYPETTVVTPGEQTTMGFSIPAAAGAGAAAPGQMTLIVCGDSAFAMTVATLPTLLEQTMQCVIVVLNNSGWGWPRSLRDGGDTLTVVDRKTWLYAIPEALGMRIIDVDYESSVASVVDKIETAVSAGRPVVVNVRVRDDDVYPPILRQGLASD